MNKIMITVTNKYINIKCRTDEWTFPLGGTTGQFTREEIERLIPPIKEALQMLKDKVYNTQHYIIEF